MAEVKEEASHKLPPPFDQSSEPFKLIAQGAESLLYRTTSFLPSGGHMALKVRPQKAWRHPTLDRRLTRGRILAEARVLVKLAKELRVEGAMCVPGVIGLDWDNGWVAVEWVEGSTVKEAIRTWEKQNAGCERDEDVTSATDGLKSLLGRIGVVIGKLHACGVVHGDLTTSNLMLRHQRSSTATGLDGDVVLIDFGLATQSASDEDRAVDLYVLERAFGSTHSKQEYLFEACLNAYSDATGRGGKAVMRKLEDVRMRGRKKSMIG